MKIYKIKEDYIEYLRAKEPKVLKNKNEKRPYVGTVLEITGFTYFIPLSSFLARTSLFHCSLLKVGK